MSKKTLQEQLDRMKIIMGKMDNNYTPVFEIKKGPLSEMALNLMHDKKNNNLVVVSDLEGRDANKETFKNKGLLKNNGFKWSGKNWVIPDTELEKAKGIVSTANKAEYLIGKLEELEEFIEKEGDSKTDMVKAKIETYIEDLANITDEKTLDSAIRKYLTFFSKFHQYSFYNRLLIYIQKPDATKVASFKRWKENNRMVNKGAKAISILVPVFSKDEPEYETDPVSGEKVKRDRNPVGYRSGNVFDISDTHATSEEGEIPDTPKWHGDNTPSETADTLVSALTMISEDMGIKVTKGDAKGGEKGFSAGDHINLSSDVEGAGAASTLCHELAHELMHWKKSSIYYVGDEQRNDIKLVEMQAESVSYVVLKHYGLPVQHHPTYLVLWKANKEKIMSNMETISRVSQFIIDKVDKLVKLNPQLDNAEESLNEMIEELG